MRAFAPGGLALLLAILIGGCGAGSGEAPPRPAVERRLHDPDIDDAERVRRIAAEARPGNFGAVLPLVTLVKDNSHAAFLMEDDPSTFSGYRAQEYRQEPAFRKHPDEDELVRAAAVAALEKIGSPVALVDLLLALDDRSPWVSNHAARAVVRLGCRAGIDVLLDNLEKKARWNETANRMLEQLTGQDLGFSPDVGQTERAQAVKRWRDWWAGFRRTDAKLPGEGRAYAKGEDAEADRRLRLMVELLGQFQFMYHNQARLLLQRIGPAGIPFLVEGVERSREPDNAQARAAVCQVLEKIDHENSRRLLIELLADGHPTVRARAAKSLGVIGGDVARQLGKALADRIPAVQLAAIAALGELGGDPALKALGDLPPGALRQGSAVALARFQASAGGSGRDDVLKLLVDGSLPERNRAHEILVKVTGNEVPFDALGTEEARRAVATAYRELLRR